MKMSIRLHKPILLISIVVFSFLIVNTTRLNAASNATGRGDALIELTWVTDVDLDLHVTGLRAEGERFHVCFLNRSGPGSKLESDANSGGGTERIRISRMECGPYQVYVHHPSGSSGEDDLTNSGAQVKVYEGAVSEHVFDVPKERDGNLWSVCALNGTSLTPINEISFEQEPGQVGRNPESTLIPGDIILGTQPDSNIPTRWSHVAMYIGGGRVVEAYGTDIPTRTFPISDWDYPEMTYVSYYRVVNADDTVREKAVEFAKKQVWKEAPYDIGFHSKQVDGKSWYCTELVWAAYLHASGGKINIEQSPDSLGVYPWEIEHSDNTALVGGHYEQFPTRNWFKMAFVGLKRLFQYVLLPAAGTVVVFIVNSVMNPLFIFCLMFSFGVVVWHRGNTGLYLHGRNR